MPFLVQPPEPTGWVVLAAVELLALLLLLGLFNSERFWWCWRAVGALVFLGFAAYLVSTALAGVWFGDGRRSSATAVNAAIGLLLFGLPGLWYAIYGRLTFREEPDDIEYESDDIDFEEFDEEDD